MGGLLLGYDIGSSAIKASVLEIASGRQVASATSPATELSIDAPQPGWAEQQPETWWQHVVAASAALRDQVALGDVEAIGIAYQMHGLVLVDHRRAVLRPAIIWCDSRAVEIGDRAFAALGADRVLPRLLNSPGNFTASKMRWVLEHEPELAARAAKLMLPGDYIALRMTDTVATTASGLSEAILWDFSAGEPAQLVLDHYGIDRSLLPDVVATFAPQGEVTAAAAEELGVAAGTPVTYRAGDQPNNALSLNVLEPGSVAATAGTSGVVYGVAESADYDAQSRVNTFVHVGHRPERPRYGVLLCLNGTGILNSWLRRNVAGALGGAAELPAYAAMDALAHDAPIGSDGLLVLPFGNGAERMLGNRELGASVHGLNFNIHQRSHLLRAAQEGVVFALAYGLEVMRGVGVTATTVRAGDGNLFRSALFREAFATVTDLTVELYDTDGAQGAARGAGIGAGIYDHSDAYVGLKQVAVVEPTRGWREDYAAAYAGWRSALDAALAAQTVTDGGGAAAT